MVEVLAILNSVGVYSQAPIPQKGVYTQQGNYFIHPPRRELLIRRAIGPRRVKSDLHEKALLYYDKDIII